MNIPAKKRQLKEDREYILANLPGGTRRVQVEEPGGKKTYKKPEDVDVLADEILLNLKGQPIVMRGKPGRKSKNSSLHPISPQVRNIVDAREDHIETNQLIRTVRMDPESDRALDSVIVALAEEAAQIEFERLEAQRKGEDSSNLSTKRARVLKSMADVVLKRKTLTDGGIIDLDSPAFTVLFGHLLETVKEAMRGAGIRSESIEQTFTKLAGSLRDGVWKEEAKAKMKGKTR